MKFHIRTRLIESFRTIFRTWWCGEEKLHFTPFHTLLQLKRDDARFHTLGGSWSFERGTDRYLVAGFWGIGKIWRPCDLRYRSYKRLYTHGHTHTQTHAHKAINIYDESGFFHVSQCFFFNLSVFFPCITVFFMNQYFRVSPGVYT